MRIVGFGQDGDLNLTNVIIEDDGREYWFENPRWISVEERLPERGVEVLGTNGKAVEMCTYWPGQPTPWESWTAFHFKPTHWMPLPKPPKEAAT